MKKLPLIKEPIINCFNDESFMFNIVSQNNEFTDWIHSDYLNLCMKNTPNSVNQPLVSCRNYPYYIPGLIENKLFRDFFFDNYKEVEFINLFEKAISNDYYVYLFLDEYYLKGKASYKTEHFSHDSLIYGVDSEKESIYIYSYNNKGKLDFFQIKYSQFLKAFISKQEQNSSIHFWKVGSCDYVYDIDMVRHKLIKYFAGENLYVEQKGYFDQNFSFGINVYDNIEKYYQFGHEEINISIPSKLLEHKVWLEEVIFYYFNKINKVMDDELKVLLKKLILEARLLKNYSIKYNFEFHLDRRQIIISKCIQKLKLLKDLEERASILIL